MRKIALLSFFSLIICSSVLNAQSSGSSETKTFQLTLVTPLGTNGTNSPFTINKFSVNILAGYHAGFRGVELGGLANLNRNFAEGAQLAGLVNFTGGYLQGAQFAGIANVNTEETRGFQGAGIGNFTLGYSNAVQLAGIVNIADEIEGLQAGGILNASIGGINGVQLAGIVNLSLNSKGAQIAGITNVSEHIDGAQIAGILNVAESVQGLQLGLLNIADTIKSGVPIGFLSIVRHGYRDVEIGISEGLNAYGSFKIGVPAFYNIFSVGSQFISDDFRWGFGYGIGTHLTNQENFKINLEAMTYQINEGTNWTEAYNGLQQLKLTFSGGKKENLQFFAGPTINVMVSEYINDDGTIGSKFPPYYITNHYSGKTNIRTWLGFSAGIRIH